MSFTLNITTAGNVTAADIEEGYGGYFGPTSSTLGVWYFNNPVTADASSAGRHWSQYPYGTGTSGQSAYVGSKVPPGSEEWGVKMWISGDAASGAWNIPSSVAGTGDCVSGFTYEIVFQRLSGKAGNRDGFMYCHNFWDASNRRGWGIREYFNATTRAEVQQANDLWIYFNGASVSKEITISAVNTAPGYADIALTTATTGDWLLYMGTWDNINLTGQVWAANLSKQGSLHAGNYNVAAGTPGPAGSSLNVGAGSGLSLNWWPQQVARRASNIYAYLHVYNEPKSEEWIRRRHQEFLQWYSTATSSLFELGPDGSIRCPEIEEF